MKSADRHNLRGLVAVRSRDVIGITAFDVRRGLARRIPRVGADGFARAGVRRAAGRSEIIGVAFPVSAARRCSAVARTVCGAGAVNIVGKTLADIGRSLASGART